MKLLKKDSENKRSIIFINILIVICVIVFIASLFVFLSHVKDAKNNHDEYKELSNLVETVNNEDNNNSQDEKYDFTKLKEINSDIVGWLKVPNTKIDYPVVQCETNDFYLNRDFEKKYDIRGSVYMDYRNDAINFNKNTILYGHNCYDGTIFSDIDKYNNIDFYKKAPYFEYINVNGKKTYKIYAVFITNADKNEDNGNVFYYNTPSPDNDFSGFVKEINKRRLYKTSVDIKENDSIMILSSCTRKMDLYNNGKRTYKANARIAVVGRELRAGESLDIDVESAVLNENPKYPQIWYDKYKKQNPYINDKTWYIGEENNGK